MMTLMSAARQRCRGRLAKVDLYHHLQVAKWHRDPARAATKPTDSSYPDNQRMGGPTMNVKTSIAMAGGAAALALIGTIAAGAMPVSAGVALVTTFSAGLGYVAFVAQSRRFEGERRLVLQPVYVRSRNVHGQVRSHHD